MKDVIVWGGTGNFKVLCELLRDEHRVIGYFDANTSIQAEYKGIPYLGDRARFEDWIGRCDPLERPAFIVSLGPGNGRVRARIHDELKGYGLAPIRAIHRTAFVADSADVGEGSQVCAHATVCVDARIGRACIINTAASVDHECVIGNGATVGPGAVLAGLVRVGQYADIYSGAVILPRLEIGDGAIVGAGAVVLKNVPPYAVVVGNPARIIRFQRQ